MTQSEFLAELQAVGLGLGLELSILRLTMLEQSNARLVEQFSSSVGE